ncbi:transcriptional regulator [Candidatus Deferrimicrobium sp.]|uniref:transcriptional regulator n=1 Tax=Candidatus Deferrimicrobium sp. TaxID=3060586 RepID=UPI003C660F6C
MTHPRNPATPPEESGTIRRTIRTLLEEGPLTLLEISSAVRRPEKEISDHLVHLRKSLHSEGRRLVQVPAECRRCGFVFRKRERLRSPGRCPVCKGESISDPSFRVETGEE